MTARRALNRERHEMLKSMLEDRRREIHEKLRSLRESLPAELSDVKDPEDQSVADFVQDIDFALMQMKSETLAKIDEALRRLERGSYGACAECAEPISEARLKALPFADLCRACQEESELRAAEERDARVAGARLQAELPPLR